VRRALAALGAALTTAALLLTACSSTHEQGPAGRVVAKDRDYECTTRSSTSRKNRCHWEYELTTRDDDGQEHEFEVPSSVYNDCRRGSAYPSCIDR
jgi:outer membrane biogenesis lipoprotein LolB